MTRSTAIIGAALFVFLIVLIIHEEKQHFSALAPPPDVTTLPAFLEKGPEIADIRRFIHDGKPHLEVIGKPYLSMLRVVPPSGPPVYIFDDTGGLVDWCIDFGDDGPFERKWGGFVDATSISIHEARQLVNAPG